MFKSIVIRNDTVERKSEPARRGKETNNGNNNKNEVNWLTRIIIV